MSNYIDIAIERDATLLALESCLTRSEALLQAGQCENITSDPIGKAAFGVEAMPAFLEKMWEAIKRLMSSIKDLIKRGWYALFNRTKQQSKNLDREADAVKEKQKENAQPQEPTVPNPAASKGRGDSKAKPADIKDAPEKLDTSVDGVEQTRDMAKEAVEQAEAIADDIEKFLTVTPQERQRALNAIRERRTQYIKDLYQSEAIKSIVILNRVDHADGSYVETGELAPHGQGNYVDVVTAANGAVSNVRFYKGAPNVEVPVNVNAATTDEMVAVIIQYAKILSRFEQVVGRSKNDVFTKLFKRFDSAMKRIEKAISEDTMTREHAAAALAEINTMTAHIGSIERFIQGQAAGVQQIVADTMKTIRTLRENLKP